MNSVWRLVRLLPGYRGRLSSVLAVSIGVAAIGVASPFLLRLLVDAVAHGRTGTWSAHKVIGQAVWVLGGFVALRALLVLFGSVQLRQSAALWLDNVGSLRQRIFDDMSMLSLTYYENAHVGDIMDRFAAIVPVTIWLRELVESTLAAAIQLVLSLVILIFVAPAAGIVMLLTVPANILFSWHSVRATTPYRKAWQRFGGRMSAILSEMMSQIVTVRAFGGEASVRERFYAAQGDWRVARRDEWKIDHLWAISLMALNGIALSIVAVLIVLSAIAGRHSLGDILLVLTLSQSVVMLVQPISRAITGAGEVEASAERLNELLDFAPAVAENPGAIELPHIDSIEFDSVSFSYGEATAAVLRGVSLRIEAGETLALVGPSGSGKSTLVKLLLRLYEPTSGRILINGRDIADYSHASLRARIGIVLQDVALFNDSIARNIAFPDARASSEDIARAAELAHAHRFIAQLPEGYETGVGERGVKLSGGERQRIAIARTFLRDPQMVVLDEATSALDVRSERLVQAGLDRLMRGRTSIVIAHRLATIRNASRIAVLVDGDLAEVGSHDELVAQGGVYSQLHATQFLNAA